MEGVLGALVERIGPELIVASGDLTHRGRRDQHEHAARYLRSFGAPVLAVPGNHDLPYTFPARFTRPWAEFERQWQTTEPTHTSEALHVVGLNSARPYRHQGGALRKQRRGEELTPEEHEALGRWQRLSTGRKAVAIGGFAVGTFGLGFTLGGLVFGRWRTR